MRGGERKREVVGGEGKEERDGKEQKEGEGAGGGRREREGGEGNHMSRAMRTCV